MCTLITLHRCEAEVPLLLAANRDESLDRPAEGPALRRAGGRAVLAPRDLRAGGTWLGVNDAGLVAGLTNRPAPRDPARDATRPSRGGLVSQALAWGSALEAARQLERTPAGAYRPFNLFVADASDAFAIVYEDKAALGALAPGVHVVGNADPDDRRDPKVAALLDRAEAAAELPPAERMQALAALCRSHEGAPGVLGSPCVHAEGYGTRSSTLLRLARDRARRCLWHADGPPCETEYEDLSPLLHALEGSGGDAGNARRER